MNIKRLYGAKGQYIGYTTENSSGIRSYDNKGHSLGYYNKSANQTYTNKGHRTNFGDNSSGLIFNKGR